MVSNPLLLQPQRPQPPSSIASSSSSVPSYHTIDPHFKAALDMQAGAGVDQQLTSKWTANITYLYTQGVHQYLSNNVTAPAFNPATYMVTGTSPSIYNYQFQSGGVFKQHQVVFTSSVQTHRFVLNGSYTFNIAKSDTQGVYSFPSVAQNPGLDYGRATFGVRHRVTLMNSYTAPWGFVFSSSARGAIGHALQPHHRLRPHRQQSVQCPPGLRRLRRARRGFHALWLPRHQSRR